MYIRFVIAARHSRSGQPTGLFSALYDLEADGALAPYEAEWFHSCETWFNKHLAGPKRMKGASRPETRRKAISWFRLTAGEHVQRMRELAALLEHKDIPVQEVRTDRPGYLVYEDEHQVMAIPFSDEKFG